MKDLTLYNALVEAWESSTPNYNRFEKVVSEIKWDREFFADGEHYFTLGDFTLTTPTLDPFGEHRWSPSVITSGGSILNFDEHPAPSHI